MSKSKIKSKDFDEKFDDGEEDIIEHLDQSSSNRAGLAKKRVNVDFPEWMVQELDREAKRLNISRQAVIKSWIGDRLSPQK